jgi:hypothetical protein
MVDHESSRTNEGEEHSIRVLTFGRPLEAIASNEGIAQKARADICSGVRSLCHALGLLIESTPADPRIIAERLSGLTPVAARMSPAAFGTAAAIWIGRLSTRIIVSAAVETSGRWLRVCGAPQVTPRPMGEGETAPPFPFRLRAGCRGAGP